VSGYGDESRVFDAWRPAEPARRAVVFRLGRRAWLWPLAVVALFGLALFAGSGYRYSPLPPAGKSLAPEGASDLGRLRRDNRRLTAALDRKAPRGAYIVIDRTNNRLTLRRGDEVVLDAVCSAGTGHFLRDPKGTRTWTFDTPQGRFRVLSKIKNPVWKKPDWAFIEEGEPIPSNPSDRIEYGTLGEYALYFGNGFMIHGTLYERLLGRPASHGCIRLGRDDLRQAWNLAPVGTPIYIH
jgi:L,D-transpeptidase YbiS